MRTNDTSQKFNYPKCHLSGGRICGSLSPKREICKKDFEAETFRQIRGNHRKSSAIAIETFMAMKQCFVLGEKETISGDFCDTKGAQDHLKKHTEERKLSNLLQRTGEGTKNSRPSVLLRELRIFQSNLVIFQ